MFAELTPMIGVNVTIAGHLHLDGHHDRQRATRTRPRRTRARAGRRGTPRSPSMLVLTFPAARAAPAPRTERRGSPRSPQCAVDVRRPLRPQHAPAPLHLNPAAGAPRATPGTPAAAASAAPTAAPGAPRAAARRAAPRRDAAGRRAARATTWRASSACGPRPAWTRKAQARNVPTSRRICTKFATSAGSRWRRGVRSLDAHARRPATAQPPRRHPRLRAERAVAGRPVRRPAARAAARVRARAGVRRGVQPARGARPRVVRAARRARRAAVLDVAQGLRRARGAARRRAAGRGGGRLRLLPRLARRVAVVLVRGHRRCGWRARATCSRSSTGCGARSTPRGCSRRRRGCRGRRSRAASAS